MPLFADLVDADLDQILADAHARRVEKERAIFEQDADAESFFLLLDGHVRVVRTTPDGNQIIARYIGPGELFGIAAALGRTTYPASAIAAVDCVVIVWPSVHWSDLAARYPAFAANTYKLVGARLQETQEHVVELSTEQVEQRIARTLMRLIQQTGRKTEDGVLIDFPITRQQIAEMTGTTLHTVSRTLSAWETRGLVRNSRQKVLVVEPHQLFAIAEHGSGH